MYICMIISVRRELIKFWTTVNANSRHVDTLALYMIFGITAGKDKMSALLEL